MDHNQSFSSDVRIVDADSIVPALKDGIKTALTHVEDEARTCMKSKLPRESGAAKWALSQILDNDDYAESSCSPACQDTGLAVFFADVGEQVYIRGSLNDAINRAVRESYTENYFRKSVVRSPLDRVNTGDNTPAVIHERFVPGDRLTITFLAKGAGSENMSALCMLTPSKGRNGIVTAAVDCVKSAGANPCPPIVLGIGIGGDTELAGILSKRALTRPTGTPSPDPDIAALEREILSAVNETGIGVQGFGGATTALSAAIETAPTHIGMLPVAITVQCHSVRHFTRVF